MSAVKSAGIESTTLPEIGPATGPGAISSATPSAAQTRVQPAAAESFERRGGESPVALRKQVPVARAERKSPIDVLADEARGKLGPIPDPVPTADDRKKHAVELRTIAGALFDGKPSADDVEQGNDGDCFILAPSVAAAAVRPDLIERAIEQTGPNTFKVTVFVKNAKGKVARRSVEVDNDFYVNKKDGAIAYCKGRERKDGRVLWPMILEKAMTVLIEDPGHGPKYGSYSAIDGGYEANALFALTGKDAAQTIFATDPPKRNGEPTVEEPERTTARIAKIAKRAWERLTDGLAQGGVAVMGTPGEAGSEEDPELNKLGICGGHAYGVLSCRESDGKRLVTLQNPWHSFEPGDTDPSGTPTPHDGVEDGRFEMPIEWLVEHFQDMHIAIA